MGAGVNSPSRPFCGSILRSHVSRGLQPPSLQKLTSVHKEIFSIQKLLHLLSMVLWSIWDSEGVIICDCIVVDPFSNIIRVNLLEIRRPSPAPVSVSIIFHGPTSLFSSLGQIFVAIMWLWKLLQNKQSSQSNSSCK